MKGKQLSTQLTYLLTHHPKPNSELQRWTAKINARPAIARGLDVPEPFEMKAKMQGGAEAAAEYAREQAKWVMDGQERDQEKHS